MNKWSGPMLLNWLIFFPIPFAVISLGAFAFYRLGRLHGRVGGYREALQHLRDIKITVNVSDDDQGEWWKRGGRPPGDEV
jgi:hypothetical protein